MIDAHEHTTADTPRKEHPTIGDTLSKTRDSSPQTGTPIATSMLSSLDSTTAASLRAEIQSLSNTLKHSSEELHHLKSKYANSVITRDISRLESRVADERDERRKLEDLRLDLEHDVATMEDAYKREVELKEKAEVELKRLVVQDGRPKTVDAGAASRDAMDLDLDLSEQQKEVLVEADKELAALTMSIVNLDGQITQEIEACARITKRVNAAREDTTKLQTKLASRVLETPKPSLTQALTILDGIALSLSSKLPHDPQPNSGLVPISGVKRSHDIAL